jgi:hypothetical protein
MVTVKWSRGICWMRTVWGKHINYNNESNILVSVLEVGRHMNTPLEWVSDSEVVGQLIINVSKEGT